ncbi:MAG: HAMP domain-containing sensor histidine kinase, partial [Acidobacteriota bacterium]
TRAFITFQIPEVVQLDRNWNEYAARYSHWLSNAPYPRLVKDFYVIDVYGAHQLRISRFDPTNKQFQAIAWPAQLAGYRQLCEKEFQRYMNLENEPFLQRLPPVLADVPALAISFTHVMPIPGFSMTLDPVAGNSRIFPVFGYTIITFDLDYLRSEFIPMLAKRHFVNGDQLDYRLVIRQSNDTKKLIYQSDTNPIDEMLTSSDARINFFRLRFEQFDKLFFDRRSIKDPPLQTNNFVASYSTTINIERMPARIATPAVGASKKEIRLFKANLDEVNWQLLLQHRAGSLEAAVASVRYRNLAISFGIMLLFGVSVAMLVVSTKRAQRLAQQQIEFVAGVSHELRTPLAVICSASENLADGLINNQQQIKRYGELIKSEGRRLTEMVEQVLEFAGSQLGHKSYQLQRVDITDIINNALTATSTLIKEGDFQVECQLAPSLPTVMADAHALQRAIQNLLSNAIKYSGDNRWLGISAQANTTQVEITIRDKGLGIAPEDLPHIFEQFYRGQEVISAQIHGSGLGLSLVKQIVEACRGSVTVESTVGRGSAFTIYLPIITETETASDEPLKADYEQAHLARRR